MENSIFIQTLNKKETSRPPIWMMRQAGRVLPRYNKLKESYTFKELMDNPKMACDITLMPIDDLGVDAAILFSDILVVPEALGMKLDFPNSKPKFEQCLKEVENPSEKLKNSFDRFDSIYQTIDLIKQKATVPLIGFCGAPFTVMCYMFEGLGVDNSFPNFVKFIYKEKKELFKIIDRVEEATIEYVSNQVKHGIDAFQLFETHAGLLPYDLYFELFYPSIKRILGTVRSLGVKTIYFPKGLGYGIKHISPDDTDFVSIDWQMNIYDARKLLHKDIGIQGNLDQRVLLSTPEIVEYEVKKLLEFGKNCNHWIFNLGHGLIPQIPYDNAKLVVDIVKNHK